MLYNTAPALNVVHSVTFLLDQPLYQINESGFFVCVFLEFFFCFCFYLAVVIKEGDTAVMKTFTTYILGITSIGCSLYFDVKVT